MAKKQSIVIEPQIEDIPFASGRLEEDLVLNSPRKVTPLEIIMEEELPWDVHESTSYIIERKTDTQFLSPETEIILNKKTKPEEGIPELYTLTSGSLSEITSPLEQEMGRYFRLKHLISYDYTNPLYYAINNYPGKDSDYNGEKIEVDLTTINDKPLDESIIKEGKNEFSFTLPVSKVEITFKFLTHKDEKAIDNEIKGLRKINKNSSPEVSTRLKYLITSINGDYEKKTIREFVDTKLLAIDSRALRNHITDLQPDTDLNFEYEDRKGDTVKIPIPIGVSFFWPDARL